MIKYSKVLLASLVASMMVGCQAEEKSPIETQKPNVSIQATATVEPTKEPQNLVEHEYVKDNVNNKPVNRTVAYKIKEKQHPSDGKVWTSKIEECDKDGNVLKEIHYADKNIESSYNEITYNAKGDVLIDKGYTGGKLYSTLTYEYDSYGDLVRKTQIRHSSGEETCYEYKYLYADDCMVKKTVYYNEEISSYTEYEYNDKKQVIKEINYNENEVVENEYEYEYDEKGNVVKAVEDDGMHRIEVNKIYDVNGNVIEKKINKDEKFLEWYRYSYNSANGLIEEIELEEDGSIDATEKITRDSKNRQIKKIRSKNGRDYDYWNEWEYVDVK